MEEKAILSIQILVKGSSIPTLAYVTEGNREELESMTKQFINNSTSVKNIPTQGKGGVTVKVGGGGYVPCGSDSARVFDGFPTKKEAPSITKPPTEAVTHLRTQHKGSTSFIVYKCPHCGKVIMSVGGIGVEIECKFCHKKSQVPEGLIHAEYKCPACNTTGFLFMEKGVIDNIGCRGCHSPIDLFFIEKKGHYESAGVKGR